MLRVPAVALTVIWSCMFLWSQEKPITANPSNNPTHVTHTAGAKTKIAGSITGRVFAVTQASDIKPARFALGYLMSGGKADSPFAVFADTLHQKLLEDPESHTEKFLCIRELRNVAYSVDAAATWARENNRRSEFLTTQADEEGMFHFAKVETGAYELIVQGRSGANEAYWKENVSFFSSPRGEPHWSVGIGSNPLPSRHVFLKLSSPETACLDE